MKSDTAITNNSLFLIDNQITMKALIINTAVLLCCLLTGACTDHSKKIAHKWIVTDVAYHDDELVSEGKEKERLAKQRDASKLYKGNVYDLQEDGTFTLETKEGKREGKWELKGEEHVIFKGSKGASFDWYFPVGIDIHEDSTISVQLEDDEVRYTLLVLKPAPGETVKPKD